MIVCSIYVSTPALKILYKTNNYRCHFLNSDHEDTLIYKTTRKYELE